MMAAGCKAHYGEDWKLYFESLTDFIAATETCSLDLNESEQSLNLVEYTVDDCALAILSFDEELQEASLMHFFGNTKKYQKDEEGKTIVGMHKDTNRYSGSKAERLRAAARAYYDDPENYEAQKERMRIYYKRKKAQENAAQNQVDRDEAVERDVPLAQVKAERLDKEKAARAREREQGADVRNIRAAHTRSENLEKKEKAKAKA